MNVVIMRSAEIVPGQFDSLIKNYPFGQPASTTATQTSGAAAPLEFRGVFMDKGEYFFSLHETATRSSQWVGLKETGQPFVVESYDTAKGSIQVKYRDQPMSLTLKQAQIIVQAVPTASPNPAVLPPGPATANPTQGDEAGRLALVAEEIRRRRAVRAQSPVLRQNGAGTTQYSGPVPQQNITGTTSGRGPVPQQLAPGNPPYRGPVPQQSVTTNPPSPGPLPAKP